MVSCRFNILWILGTVEYLSPKALITGKGDAELSALSLFLTCPRQYPLWGLVWQGNICGKDGRERYLTSPLCLGQMPEDGRNQTVRRQNTTMPSQFGALISHLQMLIQWTLLRTHMCSNKTQTDLEIEQTDSCWGGRWTKSVKGIRRYKAMLWTARECSQ